MKPGTFGVFVPAGGSEGPLPASTNICTAERSGRSHTPDTPVQNGYFPVDPMNIVLFAMLGIFIFMMFRRNKKTKEQQATLQSQFAPGVEVMTSFGLFGRIVSMDDAENKVVLELSPGNLATVHRQAVTKIVEPAVVADEETTLVPNDASSLTGRDLGTPAAAAETPEETLKRLNDEGKKDS
jgi:preprotein translocase subunit YajC